MKRLLCALLALALVLALVCVPAMADVARVTEEPKEFTVWAAYNPTYQTEWESIKAWKYFEEANGVHINWVLFSNDEMSEKLNTLIGSAGCCMAIWAYPPSAANRSPCRSACGLRSRSRLSYSALP